MIGYVIWNWPIYTWAKTSSFTSILEISQLEFSGLFDSEWIANRLMTGNNKISRSWMSSLRLWTIGPVAEFLHETTKGSKKVGIGVQKHQVWWKSRDSWWMLPKTLVASTTRFCSKKKRDFDFASRSAKFIVEFAFPSAKIIQKHQVASMGFIRCYIFFRKQYEIEQHIQDCLKSTVVHKDEMGQEAERCKVSGFLSWRKCCEFSRSNNHLG